MSAPRGGQTLVYGYAGVRVLEHALQLRPTLPPKATHFALRGIEYMGASVSLALKSNGTVMEVRTDLGGPTRGP